MRDLNSRRTLVVAHEQGNLYMFTGPFHILNISSSSEADHWHRRLGHSLDKFCLIYPLNITFNVSPATHIYQRAKQHMIFFSKNLSQSQSIFELIYMDLWDPY